MRGGSSKSRQYALSTFLVIMMLLAVVPAQAGNTPDGAVSNSSVSTYIIVFNNASHSKEMAAQSASDVVASFGGHVKYRYKVIDGMAVELSDGAAEKLRKQPGVKYVEKDREVHVLLDKAVSQIGADLAWASGYTGKGVKVCVIDTGVDANHPDLNGSKVVAWVDYVNGRTAPYDDHGHGTHVSSTIAGTGNASGGQYKGVAPEASLMVAKALNSKGTGSISNIVAAIDWATGNGAQVISMSLGSRVHDQSLDDAVTSAVKRGVTVVVAAGNDGPDPYTISCPGDCEDAITVGAVDRNDTVANFSSRGPTYDGRVKPDIAGMGVGLVAARASGTNRGIPVDDHYTALSGTSMATPMTAGVIALMLEKSPYLNPAHVKSALEKTARPLGTYVPNNIYGWGRVQAHYAVDNVTYSSIYTSDTLPASPGTILSVTPSISVTMWNDGHNNWSKENNVTIHALDDAVAIGDTIASMAPSVNVSPGQPYTWTIDLRAPIEPGTYQIKYQMFANDTAFGDTVDKTIRVRSAVEPGTIQFHNTTYTVLRSAGNATIQVDRMAGLDNVVSVNYSTAGMTGTRPGYTGSGYGYVPANGTLKFAQDQASATFNVTIRSDSYYKGNVTIDLALSDPTNGSVLGSPASAVLIIRDSTPKVTYDLVQGWNLISIPLTIPDSDLSEFFPENVLSGITDIWGWNESAQDFEYYNPDPEDAYFEIYPRLTSIEAGRAYWVNINKTASLVIEGAVPESSPNRTVSIVNGWNLIGPTGLIASTPQDMYPGAVDIWGWNESAQDFEYYNPDPEDAYFKIYPRLTTIRSGNGYWVNYP